MSASGSPPVPPVAGGDAQPTACPGCGAVLAPLPGHEDAAAGASAACARLFEETTRGLREEAVTEADAAATAALADAAYAAQHADPTDPPGRLHEALVTLAELMGDEATPDMYPPAPRAWQITVADVAADRDVVDLPLLVDSWARAVAEDWSRATRS